MMRDLKLSVSSKQQVHEQPAGGAKHPHLHRRLIEAELLGLERLTAEQAAGRHFAEPLCRGGQTVRQPVLAADRPLHQAEMGVQALLQSLFIQPERAVAFPFDADVRLRQGTDRLFQAAANRRIQRPAGFFHLADQRIVARHQILDLRNDFVRIRFDRDVHGFLRCGVQRRRHFAPFQFHGVRLRFCRFAADHAVARIGGQLRDVVDACCRHRVPGDVFHFEGVVRSGLVALQLQPAKARFLVRDNRGRHARLRGIDRIPDFGQRLVVRIAVGKVDRDFRRFVANGDVEFVQAGAHGGRFGFGQSVSAVDLVFRDCVHFHFIRADGRPARGRCRCRLAVRRFRRSCLERRLILLQQLPGGALQLLCRFHHIRNPGGGRFERLVVRFADSEQLLQRVQAVVPVAVRVGVCRELQWGRPAYRSDRSDRMQRTDECVRID